ncbi:Glycosyltransferase like family 2 [Halopseudomonas formosensis]|uniref:Glycosyltransferase like family 2 n=1 Tax=Halopseudomonas formosensis TaxID=1002526 RepID=A0A1I6AJQ2_9GAMM|nr:glycosyltransferase [Halopseudomonas formosensis]SFQ68951.1 Glycosyltransferase like family 2 [Halopseudomonas formosensis]
MMSKEEKCFVSVIIPTYHDWDRLQLCLNALSKQTYPKQFFEIIVVNNDPEDKPPESLLLPENCQLLEERKPGSYAARNAALKVAKGEVYAFTDSDCQPQEDWLEVAVEVIRSDPNYARVGGRISLITKGDRPTVSEVYEKAFAFSQKEFVENQGMAATANMIAKKQCFDEIGHFDCSLMSGGDAEWGKRADSAGFKIKYVNHCVVWHPTRSRLSELIQKTRREAGGHFNITKRKGVIATLVTILAGVLPPARSLSRLMLNNELRVSEKVVAFSVRYLLRIVSAVERLALLLGKGAERV